MDSSIKIKLSVGKRGVNNRDDVKVVQNLLNRWMPTPLALLAIDGMSGPKTVNAIERFQKASVAITHADGLIEPGKATWAVLRKFGYDEIDVVRKSLITEQNIPNLSESRGNAEKIAWGAKVSDAFKRKVIVISQGLGVSPDFLMACMAFETGETFSPAVKNAAGSGAVGLIQFMPSTAKMLGTSTEALEKMTAETQLDYVEKYFKPKRGKLNTLIDVYMAILYPAAIGKSSDYALFEKGSITYKQNAGFDKDRDGKITLVEISSLVTQKYQKGLKRGYIG